MNFRVQAALVIRGFDYSRVKKPRILHGAFFHKLKPGIAFWYSRRKISQEQIARETYTCGAFRRRRIQLESNFSLNGGKKNELK